MKNGLGQGWGFGMNGLSGPLLESSPVKLQYGFGYGMLWAGQKNFRDVVLADGESPRDVSFVNMRCNIHGIFRVSVPSPNGKFTPYAEISPGIGLNNSTIDIYDETNADNSSSYSASKSTGFNLGAGAGMLIRLNNTFSVDAGMTWDKNNRPGNMIVMSSANVTDGITYGMKAAPSTVICFRIGVRINLSNDGCCPVQGCTIPRHHKSCGAKHLPHR